MNDTTYVEAARLMAQRMLNEGGTKPEDRLALGLRLAAGRRPDDGEKRLLLDNLQTQLEHFRGHPKEAAQLLAVGVKPNDTKLKTEELAAYSVVASLILNLDEVINKAMSSEMISPLDECRLQLTRRHFFNRCSLSIGTAALAAMLKEDGLAATR